MIAKTNLLALLYVKKEKKQYYLQSNMSMQPSQHDLKPFSLP